MSGLRQGPLKALAAMMLLAGCATAPGAGETPPLQPSAPAAPVFKLGDLKRASASTLDALLGAPALTRREGEGEFRRYSLKECALIIILYPDENGNMRASHIDAAAKISGAEKPGLERCLAAG